MFKHLLRVVHIAVKISYLRRLKKAKTEGEITQCTLCRFCTNWGWPGQHHHVPVLCCSVSICIHFQAKNVNSYWLFFSVICVSCSKLHQVKLEENKAWMQGQKVQSNTQQEDEPSRWLWVTLYLLIINNGCPRYAGDAAVRKSRKLNVY